MIGILIRKWFFDLWDNLATVFFVNLAFFAIFSLLIFGSFQLAKLSILAAFLVLIPCILLVTVLAGVINRYTYELSKGESFHFSQFKVHLKDSYGISLFLGFIILLLFSGLIFGIPFYGHMANIMGGVGFALLFWFTVIVVLLAQVFWPLNAQLESNWKKLIKKSFLIFMDNTGFVFFLLFSSLILFAISVLTITLIPGLTGLLLWNMTGVKLLLYKYDYLETLPETEKKRKVIIPWAELLAEENARIGKRTLKGMIFPWKD